MKTLYIECKTGVAGDMLAAALYEVIHHKDKFLEKLNNMGLEGVSFNPQKADSHGIAGTHMEVLVNGLEESEHEHHHEHEHEHCHEHHHHDHEHCHDHEHDHEHEHHHHDHEHHHHEHCHDHEHHHIHAHTSLDDIHEIIDKLNLDDEVKEMGKKVYDNLAKAESKAHGKEVGAVHFHEVGAKDAIADIMAVCLAISMIKPDKIIASPINVGGGMVRCAHGLLPVPAPAVAELLKGIPCYGTDVKHELSTPTGVALLRHFSEEFCGMPAMNLEKIGYGIGTKILPFPSFVRCFIG